jgi:hypothetical protein
MSPSGHTISVSDSWLLGHYYGLLSTQLGEIQNISSTHVTTTRDVKIDCDIIVKCTGFEKNHAVKDILGETKIYENGVVRENLMYIAESILDNVMGYKTPFGSSYVEAVKMQLLTIRRTIESNLPLKPDGEQIDITEALVSKGVDYLDVKFSESPEARLAAHNHVLERTLNYHRRFLPLDFVDENRAEWFRLQALFQQRHPKVSQIAYPFDGLLEKLLPEWTNNSLIVGNLESLKKDPNIHEKMSSWIQSSHATKDMLRPLNAHIDARVRQKQISGASVIIQKNGEILYQHSSGK